METLVLHATYILDLPISRCTGTIVVCFNSCHVTYDTWHLHMTCHVTYNTRRSNFFNFTRAQLIVICIALKSIAIAPTIIMKDNVREHTQILHFSQVFATSPKLSLKFNNLQLKPRGKNRMANISPWKRPILLLHLSETIKVTTLNICGKLQLNECIKLKC